MSNVNRFLEAFKESGNLVGVSSAIALSVATLSPLPLLVGLGAEAAYMLFVPDSKWYSTRLAKRSDVNEQQRRQEFRDQALPNLHPQIKARFEHLEALRDQINAQAKVDQRWFLEVLRKLDYLLEKFLLFAVKEAQFRSYLTSVWEEGRINKSIRTTLGEAKFIRIVDTDSKRGASEHFARRPQVARETDLPPGMATNWVPQVVGDVQAGYDGEVEHLNELLDAEEDSNTKAVLGKRIEVLQQRHEFIGKIGRILTNLNYQMELLEDTFGLINDQIRARSPEQVLSDIEGVVYQTETMTQLLEELAPYEQISASLSA